VHGANIFLLLLWLTAFEAAHDPHAQPLHWDEWYEPFIHRAGFLLLARLINRGLPLMDIAVLTTLVDW
jgi:hypothetical protein